MNAGHFQPLVSRRVAVGGSPRLDNAVEVECLFSMSSSSSIVAVLRLKSAGRAAGPLASFAQLGQPLRHTIDARGADGTGIV